MGIRDRVRDAWSAFRAGPAAGAGDANPWGGGGPFAADAFGAKRAPTPTKLVEGYKGLLYLMASLNATSVSRVPIRLYAATGKGQAAPRCAHGGVSRSARARLATLPWVARSMGATDQVDEVHDHPLLAALDDPNPEFDRVTLIHYLSLCLDVVGSAYLDPVDGGWGPPRELWPLEPQYVQPWRDAGQARIAKYTYFTRTYLPDELIRFRWVGVRDAYGPGYSPAQAAWEYADLELKWVTVQDQLLGVGARPGLILSSADETLPMGEPERARLEQQANRKFARGGAGGTMVTSHAVKATPLAYPPPDPTGLAISVYDLQRIANIFGVPISMVTSETNLANLQAAHRQHAEQAVEPRCQRIASALTRFARRFDRRLFFAHDECLKEDAVERAKATHYRLLDGAITINEDRAEDGRPPVAWGDEPWLAATLRQPSEERPQAPAAAPQAPPADETPSAASDAPRGDPGDEAARSLARAADALAALAEREDGPGYFRGPHGAGPGRRWAADRGADRGRAAAVVPGADEGDPGDDAA